MNFFEHQDRARRRTGRLLALFFLAVVAIIVAVNAIVLIALGTQEGPGEAVYRGGFLARHTGIIFWTTLITAVIIAFASFYRSLSLRSGGGTIARELGATLVDADVADPLRRRLRNVVEEIAIASGVPVPEIYVLEHEPGINAFAAGYSPADAAITVTQGALESLDRAELQGVVAHEFGHVLNGDMRLNIRLIGVLFGILVMALIGRRVLYASRFSRDNRGSGGVVVLAMALMLVGYIGLFFGRWIKAAVSRQREYLADASSVQFTRNPGGLAGALKKIGAVEAGSHLQSDAEEINHMLFASSLQQMFATHPPLVDRIRAIEPDFDPAEFEAVRRRMQRHSAMASAAEEAAGRERPAGRRGTLPLEPARLIGQIGRAGFGEILAAESIAAAIPPVLQRAARTAEFAPEVVCWLLLDRDAEIRAGQLGMVAEVLGEAGRRKVEALADAEPHLARELRIPLMQIAFPMLRRRPQAELDALLRLTGRLVRADGRIDVFEYCLGRLLATQIEDARHPERARPGGRRTLAECAREARDVISILACRGNDDPESARGARAAGLAALRLAPEEDDRNGADWTARLDAALDRLDELGMAAKQQLVHAMVTAIAHGGETTQAEAELLRAVCASLHVPVPVLQQAEA